MNPILERVLNLILNRIESTFTFLGDVRQKNVVAAGGRSRRVLQDIGNLVDD